MKKEKPNNNKKNKGFTFLEMLLVVVILSIIVGIIGETIILGMNAYKRAFIFKLNNNRINFLINKINEVLRDACTLREHTYKDEDGNIVTYKGVEVEALQFQVPTPDNNGKYFDNEGRSFVGDGKDIGDILQLIFIPNGEVIKESDLEIDINKDGDKSDEFEKGDIFLYHLESDTTIKKDEGRKMILQLSYNGWLLRPKGEKVIELENSTTVRIKLLTISFIYENKNSNNYVIFKKEFEISPLNVILEGPFEGAFSL